MTDRELLEQMSQDPNAATAELARRFDDAPDYSADSFRYASFTSSSTVYDLLGATAAESVENMLCYTEDSALCALWKELLKNE